MALADHPRRGEFQAIQRLPDGTARGQDGKSLCSLVCFQQSELATPTAPDAGLFLKRVPQAMLSSPFANNSGWPGGGHDSNRRLYPPASERGFCHKMPSPPSF